jgi:hypothetical protein
MHVLCTCLWRSTDVTPSPVQSVQFELDREILVLRILVKFCVYSRFRPVITLFPRTGIRLQSEKYVYVLYVAFVLIFI